MRNLTIAALVAATASVASATGGVAITEMMSKSGTTEDWFEITNFGDSAVDISGWSYDDESAEIADAIAISGATSIAAGESLIVLQLDNEGADAATQVADFRAFWGGLSGVNIAWLDNDPAGLGKGDGITIFDSGNNVVLQQFYGDGDATDPMDLIDDEHAGVWAGGEEWDSANLTPAGWVGGASFDGQYGIFASASVNGEGFLEYGSLGYAEKVPAPGAAALLGLGGLAASRRRR